MNFEFSEEQLVLRKTARDYLQANFPLKLVGELENDKLGYSPAMWKNMAEMGWLGLIIPEEYGGFGMNFLDLGVLLEEMGRAAVLSPYFSTVVLGAVPILDMGTPEQKNRFLPKIADGELIFTLALLEPDARYSAGDVRLKATPDKEGYTLNGTKLFVPYAHLADYIMVVARTDHKSKGEDGITVFIVDAKSRGISKKVLKTMCNDKLCEVIFEDVAVPKQMVLGELDKGWAGIQRALQRASVASCCEMVGGAQQVLEMTVNYCKQRVQFGRPIGSFQAIQHYCANMATDIDGAKLVTCQAAWMISRGLNCDLEIAIAKSWTGNVYRRTTAISHQIHGAIGITMDYDLHFYSRRAKTAEVTFGDTDFWQETVAREIGLS